MRDDELLLRKLQREQRARSEAESLLEAKSRELLLANEKLQRLNESLEQQVQLRTDELTQAVSRLKRESEERRQAEQRFRATVESAPLAMLMVDRNGQIVLINSETEKLFGYSREELLNQPVELLIPSQFRPHHPNHRAAYYEKPTARRMGEGRELFALRKDGQQFPVEIGLNPVETDEGIFVLGAIVDISERKRTQSILDQTRCELVDLAENSNVPMHWVNQQGIIDWANQAELKLLGYSHEEYVGQPIMKFHADRSVIDDILHRLGNHENMAGYEARLRAKDGTIKFVSIHSSVYEEDGKFKHTRCFTTDITDKKLAERRLARQAREATLLHRVTSIAAAAESFDEVLQKTLNAICELVHWPVGHVFVPDAEDQSVMVSARIWHLPDDPHFEQFRKASEQCRFDPGVGLPGRVVASGRAEWIDNVNTDSNFPRNQVLTDLPVHGAFAFPVILHGETIAVLEFFHQEELAPDDNLLHVTDNIGTQLAQANERITSRMELEEHAKQLERSNRELQEFAYVASHDLKSPLRAILHLAQWIAEDEENHLSDQSREDLASLQTRSNAMARLLDDLLAYSRVGRRAYEVVEIDSSSLITEIVETLDKPAEFSVIVSDHLPIITAPLVPLRLVLQNLIENAIKHHDRVDGCVEISGHTNGEFVEFIIKDNGPGIPGDSLDKVFEIFVTLGRHETSDTSGMGLALVKKTVETHGGSVSIESSSSGRGVSFLVRWPQTTPNRVCGTIASAS